jgi:hypothetical protein
MPGQAIIKANNTVVSNRYDQSEINQEGAPAETSGQRMV